MNPKLILDILTLGGTAVKRWLDNRDPAKTAQRLRVRVAAKRARAKALRREGKVKRAQRNERRADVLEARAREWDRLARARQLPSG